MKCFYHSADLDGHCSGAIVKRRYPEAECIGINYGDPFPWESITPGEDVWMVDFSLQPFEDMERLASLCKLTWVDHHKTAIAEAEAQGFKASRMVIQDGRAGCELTWGVCFSEAELPMSVFYLGRYDIWKHREHPGCLAFQYGMRSKANTKPDNQGFWSAVFRDEYLGELTLLGERLLDYEDTRNAKVCTASAFEMTLDGLRCIAVNETIGNSQTFKSVWDPERHDAMLCFYWKRTQWTVSLFTDKPDVDVSAIAKARGGGGHKGAAGFQCAVLPFLEA